MFFATACFCYEAAFGADVTSELGPKRNANFRARIEMLFKPESEENRFRQTSGGHIIPVMEAELLG